MDLRSTSGCPEVDLRSTSGRMTDTAVRPLYAIVRNSMPLYDCFAPFYIVVRRCTTVVQVAATTAAAAAAAAVAAAAAIAAAAAVDRIYFASKYRCIRGVFGPSFSQARDVFANVSGSSQGCTEMIKNEYEAKNHKEFHGSVCFCVALQKRNEICEKKHFFRIFPKN